MPYVWKCGGQVSLLCRCSQCFELKGISCRLILKAASDYWPLLGVGGGLGKISVVILTLCCFFLVFTALNKAWCVDHFACSVCDRKMSQKWLLPSSSIWYFINLLHTIYLFGSNNYSGSAVVHFNCLLSLTLASSTCVKPASNMRHQLNNIEAAFCLWCSYQGYWVSSWKYENICI